MKTATVTPTTWELMCPECKAEVKIPAKLRAG